jgi:hypothetical protein
MKAAVRNQLLKRSGTFLAGFKRGVGDFLQSLLYGSASLAAVFINWHLLYPPMLKFVLALKKPAQI